MLEGLLRCREQDCPMIRVGGSYHCLFEYVDGLVGGQRSRESSLATPPDEQSLCVYLRSAREIR